MSLPIPSFNKTRLVLILVGFLVVFFGLGLVRNVSASWVDRKCDFVTGGNQRLCQTAVNYGPVAVSVYANPLYPQLAFTFEDIVPGDEFCLMTFGLYADYGQGSGWQFVYGQNQWVKPNISGFDGYTAPTGECILDKCQSAREELESECGGPDKYIIDEETCEGHCLPTEDCTEQYNAKIIECGSALYIANWDNENCIGECSYFTPKNLGPSECPTQQ